MRDSETFDDYAANCARAMAESNAVELYAQLDAMATDDLQALYVLAQRLARAAHREWQFRVLRPSWELRPPAADGRTDRPDQLQGQEEQAPRDQVQAERHAERRE